MYLPVLGGVTSGVTGGGSGGGVVGSGSVIPAITHTCIIRARLMA